MNAGQTHISVTANVEYVADYGDGEDREYNIKWLNTGESETPTSTAKYGECAIYPIENLPTKEPDNNKFYLFTGWTPYSYNITPSINTTATQQNDGYTVYNDDIEFTAVFKEGISAAADNTTQTTLNKLTPETINAYCLYSTKSGQEELLKKTLKFGDTIDIELGWDPSLEDTKPESRVPIFDLTGGREQD